MKVSLLTALFVALVSAALAAETTPNDQVPLSYLQTTKPHTGRLGAAGGGGVLGTRSQTGVLGIDTVPNWSSYFYLPGAVPSGSSYYAQFTWQYAMVGQSPFAQTDDHDSESRTTWIGAPIIPVIVDLRNADGSPRFVNGVRLILNPAPVVGPLLRSPLFSKTSFDSSPEPTQFNDAVQRAEFHKEAHFDWHTLLRPRVVTTRTMVLLSGTYKFALNTDGSLAYVLVDDQVFGNALFPPTPTDTSTPIGAAENSGDFQTQDIGNFYFLNTFLYSHTDGSCCILGYHSYDVEPGTKQNGWREKHYVMTYASWISPGLFSGGFQDITALSHELAETFNDPFVNNATPIWLSPIGLCQNNLEVGDVIEGLPDATYPISLNGLVYHPQNEAMLQWFAAQTPSSAIHGTYSYPDTSVLTSPSVSLLPDCVTPVPF
jgi:hypothetical protein